MQRSTKKPMPCQTRSVPLLSLFSVAQVWSPLILLLAAVMTLSACGGGSGSSQTVAPSISGNWQFTMAAPADGSFLGGLQGGFLSQPSGSAVTGAVDYSVALAASPTPSVCNSGSASITGTITGQSVSLTAVAGSQTFTLTGTLSLDGSTIVGTYSSTAGTAVDGSACGTAQTGLQWSANLVPPLTGQIAGSFYSLGGPAGLNEQDFVVSGVLTQGENTGANSSPITGYLTFAGYPCIGGGAIPVNGQISGNSVILQIQGSGGTTIGQIGISPGSSLQAVTFDSTSGGYALQSLAGAGYAVYSPACGGGSVASPADFGNVCLAVNTTKVCQQPFTLTPAALTFPSQVVGSPSTTQTITLTNTSATTLNGLTVSLANNSGAGNFTETDNCGLNGIASQGRSFNLTSQQSCVITIAFSPQQDVSLTATLTVISPNNEVIVVPIAGSGASATQIAAHQDATRHAEID